MKEQRYHELLGHLLDDDLAPGQADELAEWLRQDHSARADVKRHLYLWELYSQQCQRERTAEAFTQACKTRLAAETDENFFVRETEEKLRSAVEKTPEAKPVISLKDWLRRFLPSPRWALAGGLAALVGLAVWLFPPTNNTPTLAVAAGTRVILERDGQSSPAHDGLTLLPGDLLQVTDSNVATITYGKEKTRVALTNGTELKILEWQKGKRFELRQGKLEATVARQRPFKPMLLLTPQAEVRVLGTEFTLTTTTNATLLEVAQGKVRFTRADNGKRVDVPAGHYAIAAANTELSALPQTGSILREIWTGIPGGGVDVNNLLYHSDYPTRPAARDFVKSFETEEVQTNNFGCRLIGYIHPPLTGKYTFWIAAASNGILWLSPDENPAGKVRIAIAPGGLPRQWDARPRGVSVNSPQSPSVTLVAGRRYFIQAVQKTGHGSSHLAVAWKRLGGEREVISGDFLSPFKPEK